MIYKKKTREDTRIWNIKIGGVLTKIRKEIRRAGVLKSSELKDIIYHFV